MEKNSCERNWGEGPGESAVKSSTDRMSLVNEMPNKGIESVAKKTTKATEELLLTYKVTSTF